MSAIDKCLHCNNPVFVPSAIEKKDVPILKKIDKNFKDDIIVTKCGHVYDRHCLAIWLSNPKNATCPSDNQTITLDECQPLAVVMETFAKHFQSPKESEAKTPKEDDSCSICYGEFEGRAYYLHERKGFMHTTCWKEPASVPRPPKFNPVQIAAFERSRPKLLNLPVAGVVILAVIPPISVWALAMNWRHYQKKNVLLFVLSIPALLIYKTFSLFFILLRKASPEKTS
jgi:RING finger family protein